MPLLFIMPTDGRNKLSPNEYNLPPEQLVVPYVHRWTKKADFLLRAPNY